MPVLAPITRATHVALRAAVLDLKESDHRRRPPTRLHAGLPGRYAATWATPAGGAAPADAGLATDVVGALLQRARRELDGVRPTVAGPGIAADAPAPLVWLTRAGSLDVHDADVLWAAATRAACAEAGLPPTFVVVTREGWIDHDTGVSRRWRRLRRRSGTPAPGP